MVALKRGACAETVADPYAEEEGFVPSWSINISLCYSPDVCIISEGMLSVQVKESHVTMLIYRKLCTGYGGGDGTVYSKCYFYNYV